MLFIAGADRSGSTLLDRILGTLPGVASGTELNRVWQKGMLEDHLCACGRHFRACPFWQEVTRRTLSGEPESAARRVTHLQRRLVRTRRFLQLTTARFTASADAAALNEYRAAVRSLYFSVADVAGAKILVDSSKWPPEALVLAGIPELDVRVVHLVRDSRAVTHSWQRAKIDPGSGLAMGRNSVFHVALFWSLRNVAAELLKRRLPYVRVRYEDAIRDPHAAVKRILPLLPGIDRVPEPIIRNGSVELPPIHTISGNPDRFRAGRVPLRVDDQWRDAMSPGRRLATTALTLPLLHRYGYLP